MSVEHIGVNRMETDNHAWLMVDKYIIIDITGDQFSGKSTFLNYDKSVYVGEGDDFHRLFEVEDRDVQMSIVG